MISVNLTIALLLILLPASAKTAEIPKQDPGIRNRLVETAKKYLGVKYRYGGTGSSGFDCSGFVQHVFARNGIKIGRTSLVMYRAGRKIKPEEMKPGDLVFFDIYGNGISHVGMFIGGREFIHSPSTGRAVRIDSLDEQYWKQRFAGAAACVEQS